MMGSREEKIEWRRGNEHAPRKKIKSSKNKASGKIFSIHKLCEKTRRKEEI